MPRAPGFVRMARRAPCCAIPGFSRARCARCCRFGDDYDIYADDPEDESFYRWLFAGKRPPEPLPQGTSLQRIVSAHLDQGGKIGSGCGIMIA
ncbi:MAG TPA: hypothetical protein PKE04_07500 [Clostridia bacterium]|nr:hypothetical protein [Clostridia bacterium]